MKQLQVIAILILLTLRTLGSDSTNVYDASVIRKELRENANVVVRYSRTDLQVFAPDKAVIKVREIVTILNAKGESELVFYEETDKFHILEDAEIKLYNASGSLIEKHKKKDFSSSASGAGLVEDGKAFYFRLSAPSYPVTVEKEYEVRLRSLYMLPPVYFSTPYRSVEYSTIALTYPSNIRINHKLYNIRSEGKHTAVGGNEVWQWEAKDLRSTFYESNSGNLAYRLPSIRFNMSSFDFDGYAGDMSSWKSLGLWYNLIVGNTNRLSPRYQEEVRQVVAGAVNDREKVRLLYQYLQKNFRYVSIQLGIGGFKPFPADFVHEKKYGDCKGLSNYMEACLAAVGVKSYSAWIRSSETDNMLDPDFPHLFSNHQILLVPMGKDSIWLECTSDVHEMGHLGSSTENRYALLMTEQGGKLVRTPKSDPASNVLRTSAEVTLNEEGNAESKLTAASTGEFRYMMVSFSRIAEDKRKAFFINYFGMNQPDEFKISYRNASTSDFIMDVELFSEKGYDFKAGSKFFLKPRLFRNWTQKLPETEKRETDYFIDFPFQKYDTVVYILPRGFTVEALPKDKEISTPIASYKAKYWHDKEKNQVYSVSELSVREQQVPAGKYAEAKKFFDQVLEDGNQKIILLKTE